MIPFNEETIVDARSCIINLADGRRGLEKVMLRHYDLLERGIATTGLDHATRKLLERIHFLYTTRGNAAMNSSAELPTAPQLEVLPDAFLKDLRKQFLPTVGEMVIASVKNAQFDGADHYMGLSDFQISTVRSIAERHGVTLRI